MTCTRRSKREEVGGFLSREIIENQGIRQGGLTSTECFKSKSNNMITSLSHHPTAFRIGSIAVGAPTTADDTALISDTVVGAKTLIGIAELDANQQRYSFNTTKTKSMVINPKSTTWKPDITLNQEPVDDSRKEKQLGIQRTVNGSSLPTIEERISSSRKAVYSLAGAGLYGLNGTGPKVSLRMVRLYIIPILIYGLEALVIKKAEMEVLEKYYRSLIRQLQHLPENTAKPAIYLLSGCTPIEGQVHIRMLTFLGSIARNRSSVDFQIVFRQLCMKNTMSNSWTTQIRTICNTYELPSPFEIIRNN